MAIKEIKTEYITSEKVTELRVCDICGEDCTGRNKCQGCGKDVCKNHHFEIRLRRFKGEYECEDVLRDGWYCKTCILEAASQL